MSARILVGISTYNDFQHLTLLLHSIRLYTVLQEEFDLVVCDDGSRTEFLNGTDATAQYEMIGDNRVDVNSIRGTCKKFGATLIENGTNRGIPSAWNQLCNALDAQSEIIVILNNDLLMVPQWLTVAVDFLDYNKDNPHVGTCFWNPFNGFSLEMMRSILPELTHTIYASAFITTGRERSLDEKKSLFDAREGHNQGMGRVMCPCGCCFAMRREVYNECGPFDEAMTSFHEESSFGTNCAAHGRIALGFPWPRPYHRHGAAFAANPELNASERMRDSRKRYREIWQVPDNIAGDKYFDYVNARLMSRIPPVTVSFLAPDYDQAPTKYTLQNQSGELMLPTLVRQERTYEYHA